MKFLDGLDAASQKIVHVADGSASDDVATYGQLLNLMNGKDFKDGVVVIVNTNVTVSAPGATLNGVSPASGDRIGLIAQTAGAENGIWVYNGASSALTRPADFVTGEVTQGATMVSSGGTSPGASQWTLTTSGTITVGTTSLSFTETGAPGATYTAGNGIDITGTTVSAKVVSAGGVSVGGTGLSVDRTHVPMLFAQSIGNGSSTSIAVTHNLGTQDVIVSLQDATSHAHVMTDWVATDANTVTLTFATAPTTNQYRATVHG